MKKFLYLFIMLFVAYSCTNADSFEITGKIENGANKKIHLIDLASVNQTPDSTNIDKNNEFLFAVNSTEPKDLILYFSMNNYIRLIVKPGEKIKIIADANDLSGTYNVEGSEESSLVKELNKHLSNSMIRLDSLNVIYNNNQNNPKLDSIIQELTQTSNEIFQNEKNFLVSFIEEHKSSLASYVALSQKISQRVALLNPAKDFKYFELVDSALSVSYPDINITKLLNSFVEKTKMQIKKEQTNAKNFGIGSVPPDIALPTPKGDTISLYSLRGEYVLLDFWAAWCNPCRMENPNLVANYKKFHHKGFEIFQVSLDRKKDDWVKAIRDDRLTWHHVSDLKFWKSSAAQLYKIQSIPASYLLDKEGKIIGKNLRGPALEQKLNKLFE
ncbi:MAG: AhpC/TSA family protein [Bacteroidetes bacterium]|nr:AhpC/TSA family protein [Bacteroidota bacterium]